MIESLPNSPSAEMPVAVRALTPALPTRAGLRTGIFTGGLLALDMVAALIAANRMPVLEARALERNVAFCGIFVIVMLIPIFRFLNRPVQLFGSAMLGWSIFIVAYNLAGMYFSNLFQVLRSPLDALLEGTLIYGVIAVGSWVAIMILQARKQPIVPRRRSTDFIRHHQP
jgi:hypothetical protein